MNRQTKQLRRRGNKVAHSPFKCARKKKSRSALRSFIHSIPSVHLQMWKNKIQSAHLESDVVELAAVADRRSAGMDHAVHVHERRAAPRTFAGSFPRGAARGGAAAVGAFASGSLLARHVSRIWMLLSVERPSPKSTREPRRQQQYQN